MLTRPIEPPPAECRRERDGPRGCRLCSERAPELTESGTPLARLKQLLTGLACGVGDRSFARHRILLVEGGVLVDDVAASFDETHRFPAGVGFDGAGDEQVVDGIERRPLCKFDDESEVVAAGAVGEREQRPKQFPLHEQGGGETRRGVKGEGRFEHLARRPRVALVAVLEPEAAEADAGVTLAERVHPALDALWVESVVVVEQVDVLPVGAFDTGGAGWIAPAILVEREIRHFGVVGDRGGVSLAGVVDDDTLHVGVGLCPDALDGVGESPVAVMRGDDDGDKRGHTGCFRPAGEWVSTASRKADCATRGETDMDDRTRLLSEWVDQPPAGPLVQYLRDAERRATLDTLDSPSHVLDIASETGVTRRLPEEATVTRVDFSPEASARARETLDGVERFVSTTPESPTLPFGRSRFDAAVCVGPLDWRFLDADHLSREVSRVLTRAGTFAVTAPTPESPYHAGGRYELTYRTPDEFESVLAPQFHPDDQTYIYQPPEKVQWLAGNLPTDLEQRVADYARRRTETCSRDRASYVVTGATAPGYRARLDDALDCLLRPVSEQGFFDPETDRFHGRLDYSLTDANTMLWRAGEGSRQRYGPLALLWVARWRQSPLGDDRYDDRIRRLAAGYERLVDADGDDLPSYALGPLTGAFALLSMAGFETLPVAEDAFARSRDRFAFDHSEDGLLLHGWSYLHDAAEDPIEVTNALREGAQAVAARQDPETGLFAFDNPTTDRHQNQMYVLWGLCRAIEVAAGDGYLENATAVLEYTLNTRLREDGALLWLEPGRIEELSVALGRGEYPQWKLLFACHQSFFAIAAAHYRRAGGDRNLDRPVERAMAWLHGNNDLGSDLTDLTGLGVPARHLTTDGRLDAPREQFKGAYEIGAYLFALTELTAW